MPATLVSITEEQRTPYARENRLIGRISEAYSRLTQVINEYDDPKDLRAALEAYQLTEIKMHQYWQSQAERLGRELRAVMATDLSDDTRDRVMSVLYGPVEGRRRNPHLLTQYEQALIVDYRKIDAAGRTMIRTLFARLAATSPAETAADADEDPQALLGKGGA